MSTPIKTGWLKDNSGDKFAPKTLSSQVQTVDGILLEDKLQDDLNTAKAEILDSVIENIDMSAYETKEDAQNKLAEAKVYVDEKITNHKYSYNDLTDKPFYEETEVFNEPLNITWDGNTEGLLCVESYDMYYCKISDLVLTDEQIKSITYSVNDYEPVLINDVWDDMVANEMVTEDFVQVSENIIFIRKDGVTVFDLVFPESGIYVFNNYEYYVSSITSTESVEQTKVTIHKLDKKFIDMPANVGSLGTGKNAEIFNDYKNNIANGECSHAEGGWTEASGEYSHVEGRGTKASGNYSHAEGIGTEASGECSHAEGDSTIASADSHAEGNGTTASGNYGSHAEGRKTTASGISSHAEGSYTTASGYISHAEGERTTASGDYSHVEGFYTTAASDYQHVQGKWNVEDTDNVYAHIVGNGTNAANRFNAHTLDWDGNAWYAGTVEGTAMIVSSPNGTRYKITVSDDGTLSATAIT